MGWSSIDDFVSETTVNGKFLRTDWQKIYQQARATAGRWYDLSMSFGNPPPFGYDAVAPNCNVYGEMVKNGAFQGGANYWTLSDAGWVWSANTMTKVSAGAAGTLVSTGMQKTPVAGRTYRVTWTISVWGAVGSITCSIGGTASASPRSSAATFVETIVATNGTALTFTPSAANVTATITYVSVVELLQSYTMDDTLQGAMYHGGNVSGDTKHLVNAGCVVSTGTTAPSTIYLVDLLMCYPGIQLNTTTDQVLLNANSLPRYTDGVGVKAFLVMNTTAVGAGSPVMTMRYTNQGGAASDRTLPNAPVLLALAPQQMIPHSGVLAGNYGPFLPWQVGDTGVRSVDRFKLSSGNYATSGEATLVLCKPLATIPITTAFVEAERDFFTQLPSLPRIYDGACLGLIVNAGAAIPNPGTFMGYLDFAWG